MAQGHRPSRRGVPGGGQAGPAYLAARLGSEPSGLFGFASLCPNSSDGLDKMFLTAYEMDSWPPPGARRVARADREAELSLQSSGGSRPACPPASCQRPTRLPTSFKSFQVKSELSSGHRTWPCILGRLVFFILLGREALPGGLQAWGQSRGWTGRTPRRDPPSAHPGPRSSFLWAVGRSLGLGLGHPQATPQALPINIGLTHFCPGPSTWAPETQSPAYRGKSGGCSCGGQGGGQEGPCPRPRGLSQ